MKALEMILIVLSILAIPASILFHSPWILVGGLVLCAIGLFAGKEPGKVTEEDDAFLD